jgi:hypothetical protein
MPDSPSDRAKAILLQANVRLTRRLTFQQKCAAYALLQCGYPKHVVALVIDMADMTAGRLAKAAETNGIHPDVAREYHRLGHEEFGRIYLTDEILTKAQRAVLGLERKGKIIDPGADQSSGYWLIRDDPLQAFLVRWVDNEGWTFSDEWDDMYPERYRTSSVARDNGYKRIGPSPKQRPIRITEAEAQKIWADLREGLPRPIRITEEEARRIWAAKAEREKTSNEVDKDVDKPNQEE